MFSSLSRLFCAIWSCFLLYLFASTACSTGSSPSPPACIQHSTMYLDYIFFFCKLKSSLWLLFCIFHTVSLFTAFYCPINVNHPWLLNLLHISSFSHLFQSATFQLQRIRLHTLYLYLFLQFCEIPHCSPFHPLFFNRCMFSDCIFVRTATSKQSLPHQSDRFWFSPNCCLRLFWIRNTFIFRFSSSIFTTKNCAEFPFLSWLMSNVR